MPNAKLYVDARCGPAPREALVRLMPELRGTICALLAVPPEACQMAVIEVAGMADQPELNLELQLLPGPARTPERLGEVAGRLRDLLGAPTGLRVAVRVSALDPAAYVAVK